METRITHLLPKLLAKLELMRQIASRLGLNERDAEINEIDWARNQFLNINWVWAWKRRGNFKLEVGLSLSRHSDPSVSLRVTSSNFAPEFYVKYKVTDGGQWSIYFDGAPRNSLNPSDADRRLLGLREQLPEEFRRGHQAEGVVTEVVALDFVSKLIGFYMKLMRNEPTTGSTTPF